MLAGPSTRGGRSELVRPPFIDARPRLPDPLKAAILAIVDAARSRRRLYLLVRACAKTLILNLLSDGFLAIARCPFRE